MENRDSNDNNATQTSQQTQQQQDQQLRQQQGQQDRQSQQGGQSPTGQDGQEGQTDTETKPDIDAEAKSGQPQSGQQGGQGSQGGASSGFVGASTGDSSESYVTEDPSAKTDFAEQGQGATEGQDSSAGDSDITTGQPRKDDASLDDGAAGR